MFTKFASTFLAFSMSISAYATSFLQGNTLHSNQAMERDSAMFSNNGCFMLIMQNDGNLVIYKTRTGQPIWATGTHGIAVERAVMQGDGNFVLYQYSGRPVWASGTHGRDGSRIVMQDDGNLVIYTPVMNRPVWASNTVTGCD